MQEDETRFWLRGEWVKRRYVVRDGHIIPVAGSPCERLDPFDGYLHEKSVRSGTSAHVELATLNWRSDARIEAFCSRWGLLGLMWDREIQVRWLGPGGLLEYDLQDVKQTVLGPARTGVADEEAVVLWESDWGYLEEVPLVELYQPFFPGLILKGIRTWQDLHSHLTPTVVDHLCEPVAEFKRHARRFSACVHALARGREPGPTNHENPVLPTEPPSDEAALAAWDRILRLDSKQPDDMVSYQQALNEVNQRTRRVHQCLQIDHHGNLTRAWRFPSLLSALYMMTLLDVTDGRLLACKRCRAPFVPDRRPDLKEYCTDRCREAARKFRQRHPGEELRMGRKSK
jgi:hypothetical protein